MKLQTKLLAVQVPLSVLPLVILAGVTLWQALATFEKSAAEASAGLNASTEQAREALKNASLEDLDHIAKNIHAMCSTDLAATEGTLAANLGIIHQEVKRLGTISLADEVVAWPAINQFSKEESTANLPKMFVGQQWLGQNDDPRDSVAYRGCRAHRCGCNLHRFSAHESCGRYAARCHERHEERWQACHRYVYPRDQSRRCAEPGGQRDLER
jgi:hypothetical protein